MRFRMLMAGALTGALVMAGFGTALAKGPQHGGRFEDLGNAQWAASAIDLLAAQGLVNGLTPTEFGPGQPITVGQLEAILLRYEGAAQGGESFGQQVSQAEQAGMLSGIGGDVSGGAYLTRAQAISMIMDALNLSGPGRGPKAHDLGRFRDANGVPGWARGPLEQALALGILIGSGSNLYPNSTITRAELAVILQRLEADLGGAPSSTSTVRGTFEGTATITANGQTQETVTLSGIGSTQYQQAYNVAPGAQIYYGSAPASLASFHVGDTVLLTLDQSGDANVITDLAGQSAPIQVAHAGSLTGTVMYVGNGQITVSAGSQQGDQGEEDGGSLPAGTYSLSPEVKIVVPGEGAHASLSQVEVGDLVHLVVGPSGLVDMIIVHPHPANGTPGSGQNTAVSATEAPSGIALGWSAVSGAQRYQILESSGGAYAPVPSTYGGTPTTNGTTITGLLAGTSYTFEVESIDSSSSVSSPSSPSAPVEWGARSSTSASISNLAVSGGAVQATATLSYDKTLNPSSLDTALADYTVRDDSTGSLFAVTGVTVNGSALTVGFTTQGTWNAGDLIQVTTTRSAVLDSAGAPTTPINASGTLAVSVVAPQNLYATETASGIALSWSAEGGAQRYQVLGASGGAYSPVSATFGGSPTSTTTVIAGLSAGTTYTFEVEAVDAAGGTSAPSSPTAAVEWGARSSQSAATTSVGSTGSGIQATATITYDKPLNAAGLDTVLTDYTVRDTTTGSLFSVTGVSVNGSTLILTFAPQGSWSATNSILITTVGSAVSDSAGAPTTPIDASGTL